MKLSRPNFHLPWLVSNGWLKRFVDSSGGATAAEQPTLGLALSHGAARGLAHIGVIQVLEEEGIRITALAGSSMGAYIGALWASGVNGDELAKLAAEIKDRRTLLKLLDPIISPMSGFIRGLKIRQHLARTLGDVRVEDLKRRMLIIATDLDTLSGEVLTNMPVATAVHASCAIPGICAPVVINGKRYIDGGAAEPLPVRLLKTMTHVDHVIAVNVMPTKDDINSCRVAEFPTPPPAPKTAWGKMRFAISRQINLFTYGNVLDTFKRCLTTAQMRVMVDEAAAADVLVHPFFCESKWYDYENFDLYIKAGRKAAQAALPRIRTLLKPPTKHTHHETVPVLAAMGCGRT